MEVEGSLRAMFENLEQILTTRTVFGEPIQAGNTTLIPVVTVTFGLGTGGGSGTANEGEQGSGGGAGAGAKLTPRAIVAITDGQVNVFTIGDKSGVGGLIERVPELLNLVVSRLKPASSKKDEPAGQVEEAPDGV